MEKWKHFNVILMNLIKTKVEIGQPDAVKYQILTGEGK